MCPPPRRQARTPSPQRPAWCPSSHRAPLPHASPHDARARSASPHRPLTTSGVRLLNGSLSAELLHPRAIHPVLEDLEGEASELAGALRRLVMSVPEQSGWGAEELRDQRVLLEAEVAAEAEALREEAEAVCGRIR